MINITFGLKIIIDWIVIIFITGSHFPGHFPVAWHTLSNTFISLPCNVLELIQKKARYYFKVY